ncbi:MAG TPA: SCP2 sterol-binding domain-containing protein [Ktedonobacteraceae bacterium]|nr:SCP2 sterol-binding domain-containing protein [Ktedonobacteraceae bacterium]
MADVIDPFFEQFAAPQYFPALTDIVGSCRFDIEGMGSWMVTIKKGTLTITKSGSNAKADCVVTGSEQIFVRMIQRQQNPVTAFLQGRLRVRGDIGLAHLSAHIFRMESGAALQQIEGGHIR